MMIVPIDQKYLNRLFSDNLNEAYIVNDRLIHLWLMLDAIDIGLDINSSFKTKNIVVYGVEKITEDLIENITNYLNYVIPIE
jgi:hypothetical protein